MEKFKVGFSRCDITSPVGSILAGYPGGRKSDALHDSLYVNVVAFRQNDETAFLISYDLLGLTEDVVNTIHSALEQETGTPKKNIISAAIHTHSAPQAMNMVGWCNVDQEYTETILYPQIITAAKQAISNLQPAKMGIGKAESKVGINRRERSSDGSVKLGQRADGVFDPKMYVLSFCGLDGQPIVNLIHYGAHATAAGETLDITRDWPGYMTDILEDFSGAKTVFFNGALGDIGPRLSNGKTTGNIELCAELGKVAGEDAIKAWQGIKEYIEPQLSVKQGEVRLPYQALPTKEEAEECLAELKKKEKLVDHEVVFFDKYNKILQMYAQGKEPQTEWTYNQTYIAIGPVVFVPYPFEMFSEVALNQQKHSPFEYTLSLSNANGYICYLPTEDELPYGGYEINSFYSNFYHFDDCAEEQIVQENYKQLVNLFK